MDIFRKNKNEPFFLLFGDIIILYFSLFLALVIRYLDVPTFANLKQHAVPFTFIFIIWLLSFFIAGLYGKHTSIFKDRLPGVILNTQIINAILAAFFFYFIRSFGITPKTNLFLIVTVSSILIAFWRLYGSKIFKSRKRERAVAVGSGRELSELVEEVNKNHRYSFEFVDHIDLDNISEKEIHTKIINAVYEKSAEMIILDLSHKSIQGVLPHLYNLIFSGIQFIDLHKVYEEIFDRIPISSVSYDWVLNNISLRPQPGYDLLKRLMDLGISSVLGLFSLVFYPFVYLLIKMEDGGPIFITQERIGKNNEKIRIYKFRSMTGSDSGEEAVSTRLVVTKVGRFLRKSRIDELPQIWSVIKGDMSLIGPRPEIPNLVKIYEDKINFYSVRHLISPGLSGWAQMYQVVAPRFGAEEDTTREKLSYDLYYIKNRSFILDVKIALKTIYTLLSRTGS